MLLDCFGCSTPKDWQLETIRTVHRNKGATVVLSRATGDGKTLAIQGAAMACRCVTLLITPNASLTGFMKARNSACNAFECVNLTM